MKLIKRFFELFMKSYSLLVKQLDDVILLTSFSVVFVILALVFFKDKGQSDLYDALGGFLGGTVGTVLSIITVVLVYKTFRLQQKELDETKTILKIQRFESTFNNMLVTFRSISTNLDGKFGVKLALDLLQRVYVEFDEAEDTTHVQKHILYGIEKLNGSIVDEGSSHMSFRTAAEHMRIDSLSKIELRSQIRDWKDAYSISEGVDKMELQLIEFMFDYLYKRYFDTETSQYFRYIFNMIKFVKETFPDGSNERHSYINQIQINLSSHELALLFYNCLSEYSVRNSDWSYQFYEDVKEFGLIENVDTSLLMNRDHLRFYDIEV